MSIWHNSLEPDNYNTFDREYQLLFIDESILMSLKLPTTSHIELYNVEFCCTQYDMEELYYKTTKNYNYQNCQYKYSRYVTYTGFLDDLNFS